MDLKDLTPGSVAVDDRGRLCVIKEVRETRGRYPVVFKNANGKEFLAKPSNFRAVVGKVDLTLLAKAELEELTSTQDLINQDILEDEGVTPLFGHLSGIKKGDKVTVKGYGLVKHGIYTGYNPRAQKYPVKVLINGKKYKVPADFVTKEA